MTFKGMKLKAKRQDRKTIRKQCNSPDKRVQAVSDTGQRKEEEDK